MRGFMTCFKGRSESSSYTWHFSNSFNFKYSMCKMPYFRAVYPEPHLSTIIYFINYSYAEYIRTQINKKKANIPIETRTKIWVITLTGVKRWSISLIIRGMQTKTRRHHYTSIRRVKQKKNDNTACWKVWWYWLACKMAQLLWKIVWQFLIKLNTHLLHS